MEDKTNFWLSIGKLAFAVSWSCTAGIYSIASAILAVWGVAVTHLSVPPLTFAQAIAAAVVVNAATFKVAAAVGVKKPESPILNMMAKSFVWWLVVLDAWLIRHIWGL